MSLWNVPIIETGSVIGRVMPSPRKVIACPSMPMCENDPSARPSVFRAIFGIMKEMDEPWAKARPVSA